MIYEYYILGKCINIILSSRSNSVFWISRQFTFNHLLVIIHFPGRPFSYFWLVLLFCFLYTTQISVYQLFDIVPFLPHIFSIRSATIGSKNCTKIDIIENFKKNYNGNYDIIVCFSFYLRFLPFHVTKTKRNLIRIGSHASKYLGTRGFHFSFDNFK